MWLTYISCIFWQECELNLCRNVTEARSYLQYVCQSSSAIYSNFYVPIALMGITLLRFVYDGTLFFFLYIYKLTDSDEWGKTHLGDLYNKRMTWLDNDLVLVCLILPPRRKGTNKWMIAVWFTMFIIKVARRVTHILTQTEKHQTGMHRYFSSQNSAHKGGNGLTCIVSPMGWFLYIDATCFQRR